MPQKPLKIAKKIDKTSGNRHGKAPKMKKGAQSINNSSSSAVRLANSTETLCALVVLIGRFDIKPKKAALVAKYKDERVGFALNS
jgi:hypothetical protein